jgi:hypothetical protein
MLSFSFQHYGTGKSELEAKVWYLTCVKQFPLYGCTMFPAVYKGTWSHGPDVLLAINMDGVKFIRPKDKLIIQDCRYQDIESISIDSIDNYVTFEVKNSIEGLHRSYMFESVCKDDIGSLIASYWPSLAAWLRHGTEPYPKQVCQSVLFEIVLSMNIFLLFFFRDRIIILGG